MLMNFIQREGLLAIDYEKGVKVGEYPERILELHLDYIGRVPQRVVEFYTADDVVRCDFIRSEIRFLKNDERIDLAEDRGC